MSTTVSHPIPPAQAQVIVEFTGYEGAATLRWQQASVPAALQAQTAARITSQRRQVTVPWYHGTTRGPGWCRHPCPDGHACQGACHPLPARHP